MPKAVRVKPRAAPPPAFDAGDRVVVVFWRPIVSPRLGERPGAWETADGRVVSVRADGTQVCYETSSAAAADYDTPPSSRLRFAPADKVFSTQDAADEACRDLPVPT